MSSDNFELYKTLGTLIKNYRQWRKLSQEAFAESIRISVRQLRRWETNSEHARIENLHDLSEATGIPMQVCIALNADQPVWYSLQQRRFAYSSMETEFLFHELFKYRKPLDNRVLLRCDQISTDKHINAILSCHREIYGGDKTLSRDVLRVASKLLPDINRIVLDSWGHYVGHNVCLPLTTEVYRQLKEREIPEELLTAGEMTDIITLQEGCFFYYSSFAASFDIAHQIVIDSSRYLAQIDHKENYLVAVYTALTDANKFFNQLGHRMVKDYERLPDEIHPKMYELALDILMRPRGPWGWMLKKDRETEDSGPVSSDGPVSGDVVVGEACSNRDCALQGKKATGRIVLNGTRRTREGTLIQRFLCKECGKSFSSRRSPVFSELRSPEKRVLEALKLLAEGMPLRGVAKNLGVKRDTVRYWLKVAAEQGEKIEERYIKDLDISPQSLETLWSHVQENSLRQRATLWRKRR